MDRQIGHRLAKPTLSQIDNRVNRLAHFPLTSPVMGLGVTTFGRSAQPVAHGWIGSASLPILEVEHKSIREVSGAVQSWQILLFPFSLADALRRVSSIIR